MHSINHIPAHATSGHQMQSIQITDYTSLLTLIQLKVSK